MNVPHWAVCYLRAYAAEREITLYEIGKQAGLGVNTVSRWHTNKRTPDLDELERALKVLGLRLTITRIAGNG